jgi:hypothetical protein
MNRSLNDNKDAFDLWWAWAEKPPGYEPAALRELVNIEAVASLFAQLFVPPFARLICRI